MNKVIISGRFVRDPEEFASKDGTPVARYTLAVDKNYGEGADFINFVAFKKAAEFVNKYCHKGMKIMVWGEITTGSYTNKDGVKVNTFDIRAIEHEFCESKKSESNAEPKPKKDDGFMAVPDGVGDEGLPFN